MKGAVASLALLGMLFHPGGSSAAQNDHQIQHYRVDGWRLDIHRDRFTGSEVCTLRRPNITYGHGVLTFRFGHDIDTANALFRIDNGPVQSAGRVAVEAAGLGARFNGPNMTNPSNGEVHIPAADLNGGLRVSIEPNKRSSHRTFDVTGLSHAIETAKSRACDIT
jgi:hypothetical protein